MQTFNDVIAAFGSAARFAEAIGIEKFHGQTMKARGSIPSGYWNDVIAAAAARKIKGITLERLAAIAEAQAEEKAEKRRATLAPDINESGTAKARA